MQQVRYANVADSAPKLVALNDRKTKVNVMICTNRANIPENVVKIGLVDPKIIGLQGERYKRKSTAAEEI